MNDAEIDLGLPEQPIHTLASRRRATLVVVLAAVVAPTEVGAMLDADNVVDIVELDRPCQWSPVARVGYGCTGAYVGNRMLVTAAHCLDTLKTLETAPNDPDPIWFTDTGFEDDVGFAVTSVIAEICRQHPDANEPDIGWCRLSEEPPTVARIPVMVPDRCESHWVRQQVLAAAPGKLQMTTIGFGWHDAAETERGRKRYTSYGFVDPENDVNGRIPVEWTDWDPMIDDPRAQGDSGGPNYIRLPDGTWRLVAVHGGAMLETLKYSVPSYVSWIEKSSGVDITPCHELDETPDAGVGNPPNWGRYVFVRSDECAVAHSTNPMPVAANPNDDVSWGDGGCETRSAGPPNPDPPIADECAHWPVVPSRIRSVMP